MATLDNDLPLEDHEKSLQKCCSEDEGKWERDLTESLLEISEKVFEDDQTSVEWIIRTGWEEAVCGWGPVCATACLHPQRKSKKLKQGGSTQCILCLDLYFLPDGKDEVPEIKCTTHSDHEEKSVSEQSLCERGYLLPPADEDLNPESTDHCLSTISRTQACCDNDSPAEVTIRGQKERNSQSRSAQLTGRAIPICTNSYNTKEAQPFTSPVSLPPLKAPAGNGFTEQLTRRKAFLIQQLEKIPSAPVIHNTDLRAERRLLEATSEKLKVSEPLSFITSFMPRAHLENPDRLQWQCSFLAQKSAKESCLPTTVGFLHTRTTQNKRNVQQHIKTFNDHKFRRPKSDTSPLLGDTVLPSLTVKRVAIPVKVKLY